MVLNSFIKSYQFYILFNRPNYLPATKKKKKKKKKHFISYNTCISMNQEIFQYIVFIS